MNILVIGSGGREHALCWKIAQSPMLKTLYCAPGNGGTGEIATSVDLNVSDHDAVLSFCQDMAIDLVVVGPEAPLVEGLVDALEAADIPAFGPKKVAAQLEGSKGFTKDICANYNIPTAAYARLTDAESAKAYLSKTGVPVVIKADGLAAGKGVIIAHTMEEAVAAIDDMFGGEFGSAGAEVVIEDFLEGEEASFFVLLDGISVLPLATAQDHKAAYDGDKGPNTGGMGAYSPAPVMTDDLCEQVIRDIIEPTAQALRDMGTPYTGVLYAGLMITKDGPQLIEYNCRFGDPECQVLMQRLDSDIVPALLACAKGTLSDVSLSWSTDVALTVVMAAKGYPGSYDKGTEIKGTETLDSKDVTIFHAGTKRDGASLLATGGRVLNVTSRANSVTEAQKLAYSTIAQIDWPEGFCRSDIGWRAVAREQ
ncbi:phosphoribosylamine--glycine ligase [Kordiimonas sediminis]|uniref:Phosphoribosylamine--glycine ligase n=1 Tax=Kordiimonas sediminis TaxID=1735581 RepID=A0A919E7A2_9PROT|nr:phosphoribosylamine--glycine ligase [Kordiimonas sediminis]GHF20953.1 phosphoribosylamine--glycine ligase [Kordiimonas sediminis]